MDCPECGAALTAYALGSRETLACERCGYVGIEADHRGVPRSAESWRDAVRRFYGESDADGGALVPVRARPADRDAAGDDGAERTQSSADGS